MIIIRKLYPRHLSQADTQVTLFQLWKEYNKKDYDMSNWNNR